jgi:hypothetical protein
MNIMFTKCMGALLSLAALTAVCGCGSKDTTVVKTDSGKVEIKETKEGEANFSFEGKDAEGKEISGKYTASEKDGMKYEDSSGQKLSIGGDFNPSELGVPIYPGSKAIGEQSGFRSEKDKDVTVMASFTTKDDYAEVTAFYDRRFEGAQKSSISAGNSLTNFSRSKPDDNISVIITKVEGEVTIAITRMFKKK